jgi:hydroxymethylpyrimidine pyrophosphatase-like HAD family hydrolase
VSEWPDVRWIIGVDVDGTLYDGRRVDPSAISALERAHDAGHTVMIVTGRPWRDLGEIVPDVLAVATCAVCEDGALVVDVATSDRRFLVDPPSAGLLDDFRRERLTGLIEGDVALGMPIEHLHVAQRIIARHDGFHLVVNKGSVAVVPDGCDKASGLRGAIRDYDLGRHRILAIGDAANDLPMFAVADVAVGVANADSAVLASGAVITSASFGAGVAEAIDRHVGT